MNINKLKNIIPDGIFNELPSIIEKFKINTPLRLAHFLAQCAHESGNFKFFKENLNYTKEGLMKTFPKYFKDELIAESYARNPTKIANKVYASRMGNGPESSGDGAKYIGRGAIQLTGKKNYELFNKFVEEDVIKDPELVATKYPLLSAAWFWDKVANLNPIADEGATDDVIIKIRRKVNGGSIGLADTIKKFKDFYALLTSK